MCMCADGDRTKGLRHAKHVLYGSATPQASFYIISVAHFISKKNLSYGKGIYFKGIYFKMILSLSKVVAHSLGWADEIRISSCLFF